MPFGTFGGLSLVFEKRPRKHVAGSIVGQDENGHVERSAELELVRPNGHGNVGQPEGIHLGEFVVVGKVFQWTLLLNSQISHQKIAGFLNYSKPGFLSPNSHQTRARK